MAEGVPGTAAERPIEVLLVAPANAIGGQAQAARDILEGFAGDPRIRVRLQPSDHKELLRLRTDKPIDVAQGKLEAEIDTAVTELFERYPTRSKKK